MKEISKCEVCGNGKLNTILDLGMHPLCDDLVAIGDNRICNEYPIEVLYCDLCKTAHQRFQVPKNTLFTESYHYRARMTPSVLSGMSDLVDNCEQRFGGLDGKIVLDVGCNDGSLLNYFEAKGCKTVGVEPTGAASESKHKTYNEFFNHDVAKKILMEVGQPDLITFTNVFAHIENLSDLVTNLKILLTSKTKIVIENHYLGAILDTGQFDTYYHEHPRTYSVKSFEYIAKSFGVSLIDVQFVSRYGGNIRVFLGNGEPSHDSVDEGRFIGLFDTMNKNMASWKIETTGLIEQLVAEHGPLRAKAFPGRAAILIKLLGLNETHICAVYEITGSIKVGHYVPGTRIPILPEAELFSKDDLDRPIINMAWHIPKEVRANLIANGYSGQVIDIKKIDGE
jgi:hypothetical protein